MKQAVIATGGKQYLVAPGSTITVEKVLGEAGAAVTFADVRAIVEGEKTKVGTPTVEGATVTATVVKQQRSDKVIVEKFKSKKRYHRFGTHRQQQTVVKIETIA